MMYRTCPQCGSNLDPGESCDCGKWETRADQDARVAERKEAVNNGKNDIHRS